MRPGLTAGPHLLELLEHIAGLPVLLSRYCLLARGIHLVNGTVNLIASEETTARMFRWGAKSRWDPGSGPYSLRIPLKRDAGGKWEVRDLVQADDDLLEVTRRCPPCSLLT